MIILNSSENGSDSKKGNKKKLLTVIVFVLKLTCLLILFFGFIIPGYIKTSAVGTEKNEPEAPSGPPAPTAQPSLTATPEPTPELMPTPDPNDKYFAESETVQINDEKTQWTYSSPDLYVHITRYDNDERRLHYFVADIRTRGNQLFKSAFSDPKRPGSNRLLPKPFARKIGAVYLQNGDYFTETSNPVGVAIKGGKVYKDKKKADTLAVMPDGTLKVYSGGEINADALLKMGVTDTFSFGPILIRDGKITDGLDKARLRKTNPRSGIGMIEKGHYIGIVVEGKNPKSCRGVTLQEFALMFAAQGCVLAYNLDGGASSAMVFMGQNLNLPTNILTTKTYRRIPDAIFIGISDAVPK